MLDIKEYILGLLQKKIVSNFFYLSIIQVANLILPFVVIPHVIEKVGIDKIGVIFMAQALMAYLGILTDYGFNLTATKFISINRNDPDKLNFIYSAVLSTKIFLLIIALLILVLIIQFFPVLNQEKKLIFLSFPIVIGNTFFPGWFFQGIEEMKFISLINFISRFFFTVSIFFLINLNTDYILVNLLSGIGNIISCLIAFLILHKKYKLKATISIKYLSSQLTDGWHIFISNLAVSVYMYSNIFILGIYSDKVTLGYFSIADKCIQGVRVILGAFYQVIYPKACYIAKTSFKLLKEFYKKVFLQFIAAISLICVLIASFAPFITFLLTKAYSDELIFMLRVMSFVPIIVALNIPFSQSVIIYQFKKGYSAILILGSVINVVCNIFLARRFFAYGTITTIYITETFVTVSLAILLSMVKKNKFSLKNL